MRPAPPDAAVDFAPLRAERHVALAVSGGSDSAALMRLAARWAAAHHPGLAISILTVDHGLRSASAEEARQVASWASGLNLAHHTLRWEAETRPETAIQARARTARYGLMAAWCRAHGATMLLTAHTLDDQAETVLMRLARTLSPESLAGIRARGDWAGLPLFRPLLSLRRQALRDYLQGLGQPWIDDPSNEDPRFERVRVRQSLSRPGSVTPERLAGLADACARTTALLAALSARWTRRWLDEAAAGVCHLPREPFRQLPAALQERILSDIIRRYGGGALRPEPKELRRAVSWVLGDAGPSRCTLGGALLGRRKHGVWVTREVARIPSVAAKVPDSGQLIWDGRFRVAAAPGSRVSPAGERKSMGCNDIPAFAWRGLPWVEQPAGAASEVEITFLGLGMPAGQI